MKERAAYHAEATLTMMTTLPLKELKSIDLPFRRGADWKSGSARGQSQLRAEVSSDQGTYERVEVGHGWIEGVRGKRVGVKSNKQHRSLSPSQAARLRSKGRGRS